MCKDSTHRLPRSGCAGQCRQCRPMNVHRIMVLDIMYSTWLTVSHMLTLLCNALQLHHGPCRWSLSKSIIATQQAVCNPTKWLKRIHSHSQPKGISYTMTESQKRQLALPLPEWAYSNIFTVCHAAQRHVFAQGNRRLATKINCTVQAGPKHWGHQQSCG